MRAGHCEGVYESGQNVIPEVRGASAVSLLLERLSNLQEEDDEGKTPITRDAGLSVGSAMDRDYEKDRNSSKPDINRAMCGNQHELGSSHLMFAYQVAYPLDGVHAHALGRLSPAQQLEHECASRLLLLNCLQALLTLARCKHSGEFEQRGHVVRDAAERLHHAQSAGLGDASRAARALVAARVDRRCCAELERERQQTDRGCERCERCERVKRRGQTLGDIVRCCRRRCKRQRERERSRCEGEH